MGFLIDYKKFKLFINDLKIKQSINREFHSPQNDNNILKIIMYYKHKNLKILKY